MSSSASQEFQVVCKDQAGTKDSLRQLPLGPLRPGDFELADTPDSRSYQ